MTSNAKGRRQFTLLALAAALGVAVYLNWEYAKGSDGALLADGGGAGSSVIGTAGQPDSAVSVQGNGLLTDPLDAAATQGQQNTGDATSGSSGSAAPDSAQPNKNYGDAQLVSVGQSTSEKYFEQARLSRKKSRDEALDTLQKSLKKSNLSDAEKAELTARLTAVVDAITVESDVENLVKAKGFVDCVAYLDDGKVNVTVQTKSDGLSKEEVAQIRDIVLAKCENVQAKDITVVEVK